MTNTEINSEISTLEKRIRELRAQQLQVMPFGLDRWVDEDGDTRANIGGHIEIRRDHSDGTYFPRVIGYAETVGECEAKLIQIARDIFDAAGLVQPVRAGEAAE